MAGRSWYEKLLRVEPGISFGQWAWDRITSNWPAIAGLLGWASGMGLIGWITDWLRDWGAAGIVMFAFGMTAALILTILAAQSISAYRELKRTEAEHVEAWKQTTDAVNPLSSEFHTQIINPNRLAHPVTNRVEGKRFIDCEVIGPSNIAFLGKGQITGVGFHDCDVIVVKPGADIRNVVAFLDCNIMGGHIWKCSIFIPPEMIGEFREMGAPFVTLTGIPNIDGQALQGTGEGTPP